MGATAAIRWPSGSQCRRRVIRHAIATGARQAWHLLDIPQLNAFDALSLDRYGAVGFLKQPCGDRTCANPSLYGAALPQPVARFFRFSTGGHCAVRYKTGKQVRIVQKTRQALQAELLKGPVYAGITCYSDLFNYKTGVYKKTAAATDEGGHAVSVVGYGTEAGTY